MRFLKLAVISCLILFIIVTCIGLLFPSSAKVSRAVDISAPYDTIYKYLVDVKYWKLWMVGADTHTITFESTKTAGTGTVAKIGTGEVSITHTTKDSVYSEWKSEKGHIQSSAFTLIPHSSTNDTTIVQWFFEQKVNWYPWKRFGALANDKILGPVMEQSLNKLKKLLESKNTR